MASSGLTARNRTRPILAKLVISLVGNVALNLVLIPAFGAAAFAVEAVVVLAGDVGRITRGWPLLAVLPGTTLLATFLLPARCRSCLTRLWAAFSKPGSTVALFLIVGLV